MRETEREGQRERERERLSKGGREKRQVESIVAVATSPINGKQGYRIAKVSL